MAYLLLRERGTLFCAGKWNCQGERRGESRRREWEWERDREREWEREGEIEEREAEMMHSLPSCMWGRRSVQEWPWPHLQYAKFSQNRGVHESSKLFISYLEFRKNSSELLFYFYERHLGEWWSHSSSLFHRMAPSGNGGTGQQSCSIRKMKMSYSLRQCSFFSTSALTTLTFLLLWTPKIWREFFILLKK